MKNYLWSAFFMFIGWLAYIIFPMHSLDPFIDAHLVPLTIAYIVLCGALYKMARIIIARKEKSHANHHPHS